MHCFTSCASCGGELQLTRVRQDTHDACPAPTDRAHILERGFLDALLAGDQARANQLAAELDQLDRRPPRLAEAAQAYAAWGWPVFPCWPGNKNPLVPRGCHDATTDPDQVAAWWRRWPAATVALATGVRFDVIDLDPAGLTAWGALRAAAQDGQLGHPGRPETAWATLDIHGQVSTPRGGQHLYVAPAGCGNLAGVLPGIDYRGAGGYVLAPPSELGPQAYAGKTPPTLPEPWRYAWWVRPSPVLTGQGPVP